MPQTMIEAILSRHAGRAVAPGDIVDISIDARVARDFGGANVVKNLTDHGLPIHDATRTYFTFDCNPTGSDQKYAANQQACRMFAREHGVRVFDIDAGIGTHVAIDEGLVGPGETLVSTDSHANILGAIGAFGQGMGDQDIAHAFAHGQVWFKVPPTVRINLRGRPAAGATAKDVTLHMCGQLGADGLLGCAAEVYGAYADELDLAGRVTIASMATEMGGIVILFPPNAEVLEYCRAATGRDVKPVHAEPGAGYAREVEIDLSGVTPRIARPGKPDDVIAVSEAGEIPVDSVFIGSCTNGRYEDMVAVADVLRGRHVAPGVVLKIVPATDRTWQRLLKEGILTTFKETGALVGNAGCGGCAAGQIGQNGPGEVTVSTGNRNFPGKQGKGSVYLASPATAAASAIAGRIVTADAIPAQPATRVAATAATARPPARATAAATALDRPTVVKGRAWVIDRDHIDTDMIFHNRYLAITDPAEMGRYAFDNLEGYEHFAQEARPGDIVITGANFGCGSSRQQAVDCFLTLGIAALVAESFGAIYERNAINAGLAILCAPAARSGLTNGEEVEVDFAAGTIRRADGTTISGTPMSDAQLQIYRRGGLLAPST